MAAQMGDCSAVVRGDPKVDLLAVRWIVAMDVHWDDAKAVMRGEMKAALRVLSKDSKTAENWA
jgi:hypothetical protein